MHDDDQDDPAVAHDLTFAQAFERAQSQLEQAQPHITTVGDQLLAAAAQIARWWEQARSPYLEGYQDLDDHTRGIVDALEEVLRTQRQLPEATNDEPV